MKVVDAMHKDAEWVESVTPIAIIAKKMRDLDIGAIPVGEQDRLVGMLTDRDIVLRAIAEEKDASKLIARDVMSKGIVYCRDTEEVEDAVRIMQQKKIRRLPVLDKNKRMIGMLSLGDVAHSTSHEISGETISEVAAHHA